MKVLLISDVHSSYDKLNECFQKEEKNIDVVIFTGDGIDYVEDFEHIYKEIKFYKVCGNMDFRSKEDNEKVIEILGKKIFITHGDNYYVKSSLNYLKEKAEMLKVDAVIFGHTHVYHNEISDGIHYINSGSLSLERKMKISTYCMMDINENNIDVQLFEI